MNLAEKVEYYVIFVKELYREKTSNFHIFQKVTQFLFNLKLNYGKKQIL